MTTESARNIMPAAGASANGPSLSLLGPILAVLGHDCPGSCGAAAVEPGVNVWFVRRRTPRQRRADPSLVLLDASDYDGPLHRSGQLMREVNDCVWHNGIRVAERCIDDDSGHALAMVGPLRGDSCAHAAGTARDLVAAQPS